MTIKTVQIAADKLVYCSIKVERAADLSREDIANLTY